MNKAAYERSRRVMLSPVKTMVFSRVADKKPPGDVTLIEAPICVPPNRAPHLQSNFHQAALLQFVPRIMFF